MVREEPPPSGAGSIAVDRVRPALGKLGFSERPARCCRFGFFLFSFPTRHNGSTSGESGSFDASFPLAVRGHRLGPAEHAYNPLRG